MCGRVVVTNTAWHDYCAILGIAGDTIPTPDSARTALKQYPESFMDAWPVSTRVNLPENNDPALIRPIH